MPTFVAIDVETANEDLSSICQIGVASFDSGKLVNEWVSLIDPEEDFSPINVGIHHIDETAVAGAPTFPDVLNGLTCLLEGKIVVCHTHFDKAAMTRVFDKYSIAPINCRWLDSARVARRTWAEVVRSGYGLKNVCSLIGYEFKHHDALEDAKAAGQIILAAITKTGIDIESWFRRVDSPISQYEKLIRRDGNPEGSLWGERVVFTGSLIIPRAKAADMAAAMGCQIDSGVTKNTTILIVGDQDTKMLVGKKKSNKHIKAEELINKGQPIRILLEKDFRAMFENLGVSMPQPEAKFSPISGNGFKEVRPTTRSKHVEGTRAFEFNLEKPDVALSWNKIMLSVWGAMEAHHGLEFNLIRQEERLAVLACQKVIAGFLPYELTAVLDTLDLKSFWGYIRLDRDSNEVLPGYLYISPIIITRQKPILVK